MTTSSYHPGHRFSKAYLNDGDELGLSHLIVDRFETIAAEAGDPTISWCPYTSEVYYDCVGESPNPMRPVHDLTRELDKMRDQAQQEVWAAVCHDSRPATVDEQTWAKWQDEVTKAEADID